jgi:hypothetical protein
MHIKNARYASLVTKEDVTSFHPGHRYTSTNLKLLRSCLKVPDNMIILLDEGSKLPRATVSIDRIVILDHNNLHGDRNWSCIAFIGLLCGHPGAVSADSSPRSDAEAYVQTVWNTIHDLLPVGVRP